MLCETPILIKKSPHGNSKTYVPVPCGKCNICLNNRRKEWTIRLKEEFKVTGKALFVTLTYNDDHIPYSSESGCESVSKTDVQKFLKRLRKDVKFRYYAVSEYGGQTERPHYHLLLFGLTMKSANLILKAWTLQGQEIGHVQVGVLSEAGIAYAAKYHITKLGFRPALLNRAI